MRTNIAKIYTFDAAHFLPSYPGKCQNLHGHTFKAEIRITGPVKEDGMIIDFAILKEHLEMLGLDHTSLNNILHNPTAENLCSWIFAALRRVVNDGKIRITRVRVWETESCYAEIEE